MPTYTLRVKRTRPLGAQQVTVEQEHPLLAAIAGLMALKVPTLAHVAGIQIEQVPAKPAGADQEQHA
jgi:hypothetical protein